MWNGISWPRIAEVKKRAVSENTAKFREETSKNVQRKPLYGPDISASLPHCKIFFLQRSKTGFCSINQLFLNVSCFAEVNLAHGLR